MTVDDKPSYSDKKSSQEGRLIIGQTLMLLSAVSFVVALMVTPWILIVSGLLLSLGIKLYFDAKDYLGSLRERFLYEEAKPRLKEEAGIDFSPEEGITKDFFEGSRTLEISHTYHSYQRFELKRDSLDVKGAFVRTGPKPSKFQSQQDNALFAGKVVHVEFDTAFKTPITLSDHPAENAQPFGTLYAHGENAERFTAMADHSSDTFDTFTRKHGGDFKAVMQSNHLYLFLKDHRPFIDLAPAKPVGEPPIRFFKTFVEDVLELANTLRKDDSLMTQE